jgi:hypothetical protein
MRFAEPRFDKTLFNEEYEPAAIRGASKASKKLGVKLL